MASCDVWSEHDYLKTIVPISGLIGVKELMWKNGSSEARAPIMHNGVYGSYGLDGDEEDYQNLCPITSSDPAQASALGRGEGSQREVTGLSVISSTGCLRTTKEVSTSFRECTIGTWTPTWPSRPSIVSSMQGLSTCPVWPMGSRLSRSSSPVGRPCRLGWPGWRLPGNGSLRLDARHA